MGHVQANCAYMSPHFNSLFQVQMKTFMDSPLLGVSDNDGRLGAAFLSACGGCGVPAATGWFLVAG